MPPERSDVVEAVVSRRQGCPQREGQPARTAWEKEEDLIHREYKLLQLFLYKSYTVYYIIQIKES
jgi:hypothetical protein